MEGFLDVLYEYVQEQGVASYLETREYRRATYDLETGWACFRSTLTAEQERDLAALLARERDAGYMEEEAVFCCALSMGVELGRL